MSRRTIELDQDIVEKLSALEQLGEDPSAYLRRVIEAYRENQKSEGATTSAVAPLRRPRENKGSQHREPESAIQTYLSILSEVILANPERASKIDAVCGNKREYFVQNPEALLRFGATVKPVQIPGTSWWTASNIGNVRKSQILSKVCDYLGVPMETRSALLARLNRPRISPGDSSENYSLGVDTSESDIKI